MKQRILVTGASGFLGKNLLERLSGEPKVSVFAEKFDLTKSQEVLSCVALVKPDVVYHLGALVDLTRSFEIARKSVEANIIGTAHLLVALAHQPVKKFIFASSEEVYGDSPLPYKEKDSVNPPSPYAITKLACEHLVRQCMPKIGMVLRIGTMYGPHQPDHRFIYQMIKKALNNEDIPLNSGTKKRDYIYVGDVVDALILAKEHSRAEFDVVNIGSGNSILLKQLAQSIIDISGSSSRLQLGAIPDRIGEARQWLMDITKAKKLLGWAPKTGIAEGINKTIVWIKK